jgi:MFS family permease
LTAEFKPAPVQGLAPPRTTRYAYFALAFLSLIALLNALDRTILAIVMEPIKAEFHLSDAQLGLVSGIAFALFNSVAGIPIARWADTGHRPRIIAAALLIWSLVTTLTGFVRSFGQLFVLRIVLGVGEAGSGPPGQSLIADYFSAGRRSGAAAALLLGGLLGGGFGALLTAEIARAYGWREAFVVLGLPGLLLAAATPFVLAEPRPAPRAPTRSELIGRDFVADLKLLIAKPAFRRLMAALTISALFSAGVGQWYGPFLMRSFGLDLRAVGQFFALFSFGAGCLGMIIGGVIGNAAAKRSIRLLALIPAGAIMLSVPFYAVGYLATSVAVMMAVLTLGGLIVYAATPPLFAAIYGVSGSHSRATALALMALFSGAIGGGVGPWLLGVVSDALVPIFHAESLRYSLVALLPLQLVAGFQLYAASRTIEADSHEDAAAALA